jgi:hypothetical protein
MGALRLDQVIGRMVYAKNGRRVGRLEECRADRHGSTWIVKEWLLGGTGLLERLGATARRIVGLRRRHGFRARWDQIDLSDPNRLHLTCPVEELEKA